MRIFFAEFLVEEEGLWLEQQKVGYSDLSPSRAPRTWPPEARCLRQPEKARHLCCEGIARVTWLPCTHAARRVQHIFDACYVRKANERTTGWISQKRIGRVSGWVMIDGKGDNLYPANDLIHFEFDMIPAS